MEKRKRRFKGNLGDVRFDLVSFEWNALSRLAAHWAKRFVEAPETVNYDPDTRIPEFRAAVLSGKNGYPGMGRGVREDVPYELLQSDRVRVYRVIKELKDKLGNGGLGKWIKSPYLEMEFKTGQNKRLKVSVPFPVYHGLSVPNFLAMVAKIAPSELAEKTIEERLGTKERTLQTALADKRERVPMPSEAQSFLASAFLEISSRPGAESSKRAAAILDGLYSSGYHPFLGYYLVQTASFLKERPICEVDWKVDALETLCDAVAKGKSPKAMLFSDLI